MECCGVAVGLWVAQIGYARVDEWTLGGAVVEFALVEDPDNWYMNECQENETDN